jgi:molybdenum-dependent DNA-binding transcriptional regulator ModE
MIIIDGDDELIGQQVFKFLNAVYQKGSLLYAYTQHIKID